MIFNFALVTHTICPAEVYRIILVLIGGGTHIDSYTNVCNGYQLHCSQGIMAVNELILRA